MIVMPLQHPPFSIFFVTSDVTVMLEVAESARVCGRRFFRLAGEDPLGDRTNDVLHFLCDLCDLFQGCLLQILQISLFLRIVCGLSNVFVV